MKDPLLEQITELCYLQRDLEDQYQAKIAEAEKLKQELITLTSVTLPELFDSLGLAEITLQDGSQIQVKDDFKGGDLTDPDGIAWLAEHGHSDIVKKNVVCAFTKGEYETAEAAFKLLQESGYDPQSQERVHHQTLKAAIRKMLEAGDEVPYETLKVFHLRKTIYRSRD